MSFAYLSIPSILFLFSSFLFFSSPGCSIPSWLANYFLFSLCPLLIPSASVVSSNWTRPSQVQSNPFRRRLPQPSQANLIGPVFFLFFFFARLFPRSSLPVPSNSLRKIAPIAPAKFPTTAPSDSHMFHLHSAGATRDDRHP